MSGKIRLKRLLSERIYGANISCNKPSTFSSAELLIEPQSCGGRGREMWKKIME